MSARPEYVRCVARTHIDYKHLTWCGKRHDEEVFMGVNHAAENGLQGGLYVVCPECNKAIAKACRMLLNEVKKD